jgi:hypothetical protein
LIVFGQSGSGRVVAVTSGLGRWTPQWLAWHEWPLLAGGLADWSTGTGQGEAYAISVSDFPGGLQVDAELRNPSGQPASQDISLVVDSPKALGQRVSLEQIAAGRWRAELPEAGPGLYAFRATTSSGAQRHLHLRRHRGEDTSWGTNPALDEWRRAGLLRDWNPGLLQSLRDGAGITRPFDRTLVGLGLALFLTGIGVDRMAFKRTAILQTLLSWRVRAMRAFSDR